MCSIVLGIGTLFRGGGVGVSTSGAFFGAALPLVGFPQSLKLNQKLNIQVFGNGLEILTELLSYKLMK